MYASSGVLQRLNLRKLSLSEKVGRQFRIVSVLLYFVFGTAFNKFDWMLNLLCNFLHGKSLA